jgi:hypothetical protein
MTIHDLGSAHHDSFRLQNVDELVEFPLGTPNHPRCVAPPRHQPQELAGQAAGRVEGYRHVVGRDGGPLHSSDDHFLQRIPLGVGADRHGGTLVRSHGLDVLLPPRV